MAKLLPGQQLINGVSNLIFGTNTPNYDTSLISNTNIQSQMKAANITVIRAGFTDSSGNKYTDAQLDAQYNAIHNAGAVMLGILPHANASYCQHVVTYMGSRCMMYEYSNEPDISNGFNVQSYTNEWNQVIPLVRAINPNAAYIGPVLGVFSNAGAWITGSNSWLAQVKAKGNAPDAVSVHIYPCTGGSIAQSTCISRAAGIGSNVASLRSGIKSILGYDVPLCLTEWNADAYYNNAPGGSNGGQGYNSNASSNNSFNNTFAIDALEGFVSNGLDMCCHFELDYFMANKNGATSSAAQYLAFQSETKKYNIVGGTASGGGGGTSTSTLSASPTSLSYNGAVNGSGQTQNVTITNTASSGGTISPAITYSAYSSLNWITISGGNTMGGNSSLTLSVGCGPQSGMPAGTYTATIAVTLNGVTVNISVTLTITGGSNTAMHIYVPAYAYPTDPSGTKSTWHKYESAGTAVAFIIANPNSGPGSSQNSDFTNGIADMHTAGIKVLGYVNTSDHTNLVTEATVKSQIDQWYTWYPTIDGISLDTAIATSANLQYYTDLYNYIKGKGGTGYVKINPASVPPESYMKIVDTVCVFEDVLGNIGNFVPQAYMANYPATKFAITILGMTNTVTVDSTMNSLRSKNVGLVYLTDQTGNSPYFTPPNDTVWNETIADLGTATTPGPTSGGGTPTTTTLSTYFAAASSTTLTTANQLYTVANSTGTPTSTWSYSRVGTASGFGEVSPQTETVSWEALSTIGSPSGSGFLYESVALEGKQISAGNWGATIRLNAAQNGDGTDGTGSAGTLVGVLYVRAFKRSNVGVYTPIVTMSLLNQTIPAGRTTYQIPNVATSTATPFEVGSRLYLDIWVNVTSNTNNSTVQDIRLNRLSTDTTGMTGDVLGFIVTPGYITQAATTGDTSGTTYSDMFTRANQSGFGIASDGEAWTLTGTGTASIVSNKGVIVSTASDTYAQLGTNTLADVDVRGDITLAASGDNASVVGRYSVSGGSVNCYKLSYNTGSLDLKKCVAGTTTSLINTAITLTIGTAYTYHLRIQGNTLYGNVYQIGTTEPTSWMLTVTDATFTSAGGFGIRGNTASGSAGIQYDNFSAGAPNTGGVATIMVSSTSLTFSATQGGSITSAQNLTLTNSGAISGNWTETISYTQGSGWLSLGTTSGTLAVGATQSVAFSCDPSGLAPGTYNASVIFTMASSTANVAVTFTVVSPSAAFLSVSPTSLNFSVTR